MQPSSESFNFCIWAIRSVSDLFQTFDNSAQSSLVAVRSLGKAAKACLISSNDIPNCCAALMSDIRLITSRV